MIQGTRRMPPYFGGTVPINVDPLLAEALMLKYKEDSTYVLMGFTQCERDMSKIPPGILLAATTLAARRRAPLLTVMVNKLRPGLVIPKHRDYIPPTPMQPYQPRVERWHLPLQTNEHCAFWDERDGERKMSAGEWHGPVPYWLLHTAWNRGSEWRIHVIVDLDVPEPLGDYTHGDIASP